MKTPNENSRQTVERFLTHLGEPVGEDQTERAVANVLGRMRTECVPNPARVLTMPTVSRPARMPIWSTVAAAVVLMLAGGVLHIGLLRLAAPNAVANSLRGDVTFAADGRNAAKTQIESGRLLRAGENGGVLTLGDGSHVEISPRAELSVVRVSGDLRVRLASGTVLITAAKQKEGRHLYVETQDCLISVIGTVFQVNAEKSGSRISVIEGEVHVQRGEISQTLVAGQQASTSPELGPLLQNVPAPVSVAQQNVPPPAQTAPPAPKPFDDVVWVTPPPPQTGSGIVRGVVKNGASGEGIPDVTVTLCRSGAFTKYTQAEQLFGVPANTNGDVTRNKTYFFAVWDSVRCQQEGVKTDAAGHFEFRNVASGQYVVSAEREGYRGPSNSANTADPKNGVFRYFNYSVGYTFRSGGEPTRDFAAYRSATPPGDRTEVTLNSNDAAAEVSLTLVRGSLSGHVRDADGKPVANAVVRIVARAAGAAVDGPTVSVALTNDLGEYKVYGLQAGDYRVGATVPNGFPGSEIWFSRNTNPGGVTGLTVSDGEEITNIDIVVARR